MIDHAKAHALIEPFEGTIPWMYLDTHGYVTVGVGNLLAKPQTAIALCWVWRDPQRNLHSEPNEMDIVDEWTRVHGATPGLTASSYRVLTSMVLHEKEITRLFNKRVDEFETSLQHHFPAFSSWPEPARLAVLDMAFNLGAGALGTRWPKLKAALEAQDWGAAAVHSHRPQSRDARNAVTRKLFEEATAG